MANRKVDETDGIEIMYLLDPKYWGDGYASEVAKNSIQYAIELMCVKRIIGKVIIVNRDGFQYIKVIEANVKRIS
ncbi:GNAT family N-acetyltransferase [Bacillus cereus]|uniref:GNAT family N-acetyltransferase n=1 Tax=Bacillus cereus TaxID=1396 RepID=UPI00359C376C